MSRAESYAHRVRNAAYELGTDPQRIRRGLTFQRVLVRIARVENWVLKGGFCLEVRLELDARATVDLDLVTKRTYLGPGGSAQLQDELDAILAVDPDDDGFTFDVLAPKRVNLDGDREAWRVSVNALVGGQHFENVKLDVVAQFKELVGAIEKLRVEPPINAVGLKAVEVDAVDVAQHAAGKLHAMSRTYAGDRPSSRVKDLVDMVLLIEAGVLDPRRTGARLVVVYQERDGSGPPRDLPPLPPSWVGDYRVLLDRHELDVVADTAEAAHLLVTDFYLSSLNSEGLLP